MDNSLKVHRNGSGFILDYLQNFLKKILLFLFVVILAGVSDGMAVSQDNQSSASIVGKGRVLLIRHAIAPGTGDPGNFKIGDCSTQRNLDSRGRQQAIDMGQWLRSQGIKQARVYSSQWCRCKDTAALMRLGTVNELPALNSFFQRWEDKEPNISALRQFIAEQKVDEDLIILVTHQVTITALTGIYPASGSGVLLFLDGKGSFEVGPTVQFD